jgi:hypothetical protein
MGKITILLSSRVLRTIVCDDSTFVFNVNTRQLATSTFKAWCISPIISQTLESNSAQPFYELYCPDNSDCFEDILSIGNGTSSCVGHSWILEFVSVSKALKNDGLALLIIDQDSVSMTNTCCHLTA